MNRIIVVGGGAAGMMAAIAAAEAGASVMLLEHNEKLGKKLYITGKGRCNVTNACSRDDFFAHVVSNPRFLYSSYDAWSNWDMTDFLEQCGLALKTERGNRVFPQSDKSSDVIRTLERAMKRAGVKWRLHTRVKALVMEPREDAAAEAEAAGSDSPEKPRGRKGAGKKLRADRVCRGVLLESGEVLHADAVIVATGGLSYPSTGSDGDGYEWAQAAGHEVTPCRPALVPFDAQIGGGIPCSRLQGLALRNIGMQIRDGEKVLAEDFGELLFTHFGVSGPVVLTASNLVSARMQELAGRGSLAMSIDLKPALTEEQLDARLVRELTAGANKQMKNLLGSLFPAKLIPVMLELTGIPAEACGREISRAQRAELLRRTKAFPVTLLRTRGFAEAIITQGGIAVKEIDPRTMASRRAEGLYFAGEVLDVEAFTGGYNLQIAWSTGHAAGTAAAARAAE